MLLSWFVCLIFIGLTLINGDITLRTQNEIEFVNDGYEFPLIRIAIYYYSDIDQYVLNPNYQEERDLFGATIRNALIDKLTNGTITVRNRLWAEFPKTIYDKKEGEYTPARLMTIDIDFNRNFTLYEKIKNYTDGFNADNLGEEMRSTAPLSSAKLIYMIYGGFAFTNIIGDAPEIIQSGTKELITPEYNENDFKWDRFYDAGSLIGIECMIRKLEPFQHSPRIDLINWGESYLNYNDIVGRYGQIYKSSIIRSQSSVLYVTQRPNEFNYPAFVEAFYGLHYLCNKRECYMDKYKDEFEYDFTRAMDTKIGAISNYFYVNSFCYAQIQVCNETDTTYCDGKLAFQGQWSNANNIKYFISVILTIFVLLI